MKYRETDKQSNEVRLDYLKSVKKMIADRNAVFSESRMETVRRIGENQAAVREDFKKMLGWPLTLPVKTPLSVEKTLLSHEDGYDIFRMSFEIWEGFRFYGLFFERPEKLPLVYCLHGGLGTPELISGMLEGGTANYNDMVERVQQYPVQIFAPQLLLWSDEKYGIDCERESMDAALKQVGGSITAVEIYCMRSALSYFEALDCVNEEKMGMVGLSYGGFYTLFTAAVEPRFKANLSCSFFNERQIHCWVDWVWQNASEFVLDSETALLSYPRKLWLAVSDNDEIFDLDAARREYARLEQEYDMLGWDKSRVKLVEFEGVHEFIKGREILDEYMEELNR